MYVWELGCTYVHVGATQLQQHYAGKHISSAEASSAENLISQRVCRVLVAKTSPLKARLAVNPENWPLNVDGTRAEDHGVRVRLGREP